MEIEPPDFGEEVQEIIDKAEHSIRAAQKRAEILAAWDELSAGVARLDAMTRRALEALK